MTMWPWLMSIYTIHGHREDSDNTMFEHREYHNALYTGDGVNPDPSETLTESQNSYNYVCNNSA